MTREVGVTTSWRLERIIAGAQTGADRGGLDAAIELGMPHGGWCPRGRKAEDGRVPECYQLVETDAASYRPRTQFNVRDSDGTVIFARVFDLLGGEPLSPGSQFTYKEAVARGKPVLLVNLAILTREGASRGLHDWLAQNAIAVLNVAGTRESKAPGIQEQVKGIVLDVLRAGFEKPRDQPQR